MEITKQLTKSLAKIMRPIVEGTTTLKFNKATSELVAMGILREYVDADGDECVALTEKGIKLANLYCGGEDK